MQRINVIGTSSVGKTTFARELAQRLELPYVELDALYWEPGWSEAAPEVMRSRVASAVQPDAWVVDGNYGVVRDLVWARADTVVWLDYPLRTVLWRYLTRTVRRIRTAEELWPGTGNRERLSMHLLQRDGLLWWILGTYHRRRRDYPRLLAEHPEIEAIRLGSPRAARRWIAGVGSGRVA
jgi:adenylate kinase family enzyme